MNARIRKLLADKLVLFSFLCILAIFSLYGIFLLFTYQQTPSLVPLFNQIPWGIERLGAKIQLFLPLGIASLAIVINTFLLLFISQDMPLVTRLVSLTNVLIALFALLVVVRTVLIII